MISTDQVPPNKPVFNKRIFWDIDIDKLDYDAKASFVVERVFERGDVEDIRQCRRYYGDEKLASALLNAKYLSLPAIYLAAAVIDKPLTDFKCFTPKRLNPQHYPY